MPNHHRQNPADHQCAYAVRTGDVGLLAGVCAGKHGRWGRICVLDAGHEDRAPP
ncbi:hypothetical protein NRF20_00120 [Streptomyces sp. R-74717]|uniref:hypothetical protein n=1 Tax=Streptomyces sp. R-74717 TaxID=2969820 RepID=UPI0039B6E0B5